MIQVKWLISHHCNFIHLLCHCLPLILISNRYTDYSFIMHAFKCPIILKLCLLVSYNSQNYVCNYACNYACNSAIMPAIMLAMPMILKIMPAHYIRLRPR